MNNGKRLNTEPPICSIITTCVNITCFCMYPFQSGKSIHYDNKTPYYYYQHIVVIVIFYSVI